MTWSQIIYEPRIANSITAFGLYLNWIPEHRKVSDQRQKKEPAEEIGNLLTTSRVT